MDISHFCLSPLMDTNWLTAKFFSIMSSQKTVLDPLADREGKAYGAQLPDNVHFHLLRIRICAWSSRYSFLFLYHFWPIIRVQHFRRVKSTRFQYAITSGRATRHYIPGHDDPEIGITGARPRRRKDHAKNTQTRKLVLGWPLKSSR